VNAALFQSRAKRHLRNLIAAFLASVAGFAVLSWISLWASPLDSWEGTTVELVFGLAGALCGFIALWLGVLIYGWRASYRQALRDIQLLSEKPEVFLHLHGDLLGPIRWH